MRSLNVCAVTGIVTALVGLGGCQLIGPNAIGQGRERYNSILHSTAMEQTMSNIVRVYQHEPTLFMDVTEVDATLTMGGTVTGAATNIGAQPGRGTSAGTLAGQVSAVTGVVQYSETPTIRYQPLLGQALVAQLVTPVSIDALGLLYDSGWPAATLLDLASAYLTLNYDEFYSAFNTIIELDDMGALELAAAKSELAKPSELEQAGKSGATNPNDSLILYLRPFSAHAGGNNLGDERRLLQLWVRLLRIYSGTQPAFAPRDANCARLKLSADSPEQLKAWDVGIGARTKDQLDTARNCLPSRIELRAVPAIGPGGGGRRPEFAKTNLISGAPLMRTYSALGILKTATERPHPKIEFVTAARYRQIRDPATHPWNDDPDSLSYYTLLPEDEDSIDCPDVVREQKGGCDNPSPGGRNGEAFSGMNNDVARWIAGSAKPEAAAGDDAHHGGFVYEERARDVLDDRYLRMNQRLGSLRRYILIVVGDYPPDRPYVVYSDNARWYYIAGDDTVSKKNFHLLSLFMTIMAVPQTTPPLSPVINVGG